MMALLKRLFARNEPEAVDIEDFLNNFDVTEEEMYANVDMFVKPITLSSDDDAALAMKEVREGNEVLLNIEDLAKRNPVRLKTLLNKIKSVVDEIDGDVARISHERILVTPARVKILKKK
jgi:hypothetical protein